MTPTLTAAQKAACLSPRFEITFNNETIRCPEYILKYYLQRYHDGIAKGNNSLTPQAPEDVDLSRILELQMGPRRDDLDTVIPLTVIYSLIFLTGLFGNVCTCIVIAKNKFMHTATNYYLFNLAVADLLLLVFGLPVDVYTMWSNYPWIFGEPFCIVRVLFAEVSTYTSILTITAFTIERYIAICHPMKAQMMSSLHRAVRVIFSTWCISVVSAIPQTIQFGVEYQASYNNTTLKESAMCAIIESREMDITFQISTLVFFVLPMSFISVLYTLIAITIRASTLSRVSSDSSSKEHLRGIELHAQQQAKARRSVVKMLVAVVVAFFVCWAPFHTERLMTIYISQWNTFLLNIRKKIFYFSGVFYFISCTINPILYSIMSRKFRQAFKQTVLKCKKQRQRQHHFSYKFVHRNGHTETSYTSVDPATRGATAATAVPTGGEKGGHRDLALRRSGSNSKRQSPSRSISGSSLKSTDELCQEEERQQVLFQIKCYDNNRNTAEVVFGVC